MIFRTNKYYLLILLAAFIVGGCGNFSGNYEEIESSASSESTTTTTDTIAPTVLSTYPSYSDSSVAPNISLTVAFSEAMDTTTITTNSSGTSCNCRCVHCLTERHSQGYIWCYR